MKKIFTLIIGMISAFGVSAADFQLLFGATADTAVPVNNGATYEAGIVLESSNVFPSGMSLHAFKQDAQLWIKAPGNMNLTMYVETDNDLQVCSFDGLCVNALPGSPATKTGVIGTTSAVGIANAQIHQSKKLKNSSNPEQDACSQMKKITAKVTLYPTGQPSNTVTVNVILHNVMQADLEKANPADVDRNGDVNIADAQCVIDAMLGGSQENCDVDNNGDVNIADAQCVIDAMLG